MRIEHHKNLHLCQLTPEQNQRTCNYWYTVTVDGFRAHTAFNAEAGLLKWLNERGLSLSNPLLPRGEHAVQAINGSYQTCVMMDKQEFDALMTPTLQDKSRGSSGQGASSASVAPKQIRVLSNAQYTAGILTQSPEGQVVVNYLNPNVRDRVVYDYAESAEVLEAFDRDEWDERALRSSLRMKG
jgi:hypothetical protein